MKLTKYQHACFVAEKDSVSIIVDPGSFTHDFIMPKHVSAIFVTHNHPDHCDKQRIVTILREHPKAVLLGDESIIREFPNEHTQAVTVGETIDAGGITLQFVGGVHEPIDVSMPTPPNLGIIIDSELYYPGDSFFIPAQQVKALALPISAPWMKISESLEFLRTIKPLFAFPTHDAILSPEGQTLIDTMVKNSAEKYGIRYERINEQTVEL